MLGTNLFRNSSVDGILALIIVSRCLGIQSLIVGYDFAMHLYYIFKEYALLLQVGRVSITSIFNVLNISNPLLLKMSRSPCSNGATSAYFFFLCIF
jgi:hypothetical protein